MKEYLAYLKKTKQITPKSSFVELKNELNAIESLSTIIEEIKKKSVVNRKDALKKKKNADILFKLKLLLSEMKDKDELRNKLELLTYHIGLMRKNMLTNDIGEMKKSFKMFTKNKYSSISGVIKDIKYLEQHINEFNHLYTKYIQNTFESLDQKLEFEQDHWKSMKKLNTLLEKKKIVALSLGRMFIQAGKHVIENEKERNAVKNDDGKHSSLSLP